MSSAFLQADHARSSSPQHMARANFRVESGRAVRTLRAGVPGVLILSNSCCLGGCVLLLAVPVFGQTSAPPAKLQSTHGTVDYSRAATTNWNAARIGQPLAHYDRVRTRELSEAAVQLVDLSVIRLAELSLLEMVPPREANAKARFHFEAGKMYFIDRLKPREVEIQTRSAVAAILGTEFSLIVDADGRTELNLIDGKVQLANALGAVTLDSGDRGIVQPGQAPIKQTAVLKGTNVVQWYMYYPGVLDPDELGLTAAEAQALAPSLEAYRAGDLLAALTNYPDGRANISSAEAAYRAGLLLSSGRVTNYAAFVQGFDGAHPSFSALRLMVAAVLQETNPPVLQATNAGQLIAKSYYMQATYNLDGALSLARRAVEHSPDFGFGWARVAELEFSFGRNRQARAALERALALAPRNAQAHALRGFILLGERRVDAAVGAFDMALEIDKRLANAWLGRGLARFQQGRRDEGRADIQTAAAMEPNRWLLRSYLGKAYLADAGHSELAFREFDLNREMDPNDPTPWLYSALLNHQEHRTGEAIADLEHSVALNDNRRVYRSRLLLDQDLAVRSAGLAPIYQRAGMEDVSVREAARAVTHDYANYSAHLFLANSYDALRDPTRFNLRYETAWFNELLLANFLAPVGAGVLSQNISQQEYFRLFEGNRAGLITDTRYRSDDQYREIVSHFGTFGNTAYSLDLDYQHNAGVRPNNELDRIEWYTTIKHQLTPQDTLLLITKYQDYHSGDNQRYYDPASADRDFTFDEDQRPVAVGGYHREWSPGVHTLVLGGRIENDQRFSNRAAPNWVFHRDSQLNSNDPPVVLIDDVGLDWEYRSRWEVFTAEAQQLWDSHYHTLVAGGRWQGGEFDTESRLTNPTAYPFWPNPPEDARFREDFQRISGYLYETLKLPWHLRVTGGVTYENLAYPRNTRTTPISPGESTRERFNPKASIVWDIATNATVRGAYARSLGGVSAEESYRLEPTQLAGFSQDFRTLIPESLAGSVSAPDHEIAAAALDMKFRTRTYVGLQAGILQSEVRRDVGVFDLFFAPPAPTIVPSTTRQDLDYEEKFAGITLNQLISDEWAVSAQYFFVRSELTRHHPQLPPLSDSPNSTNRAELHRVNLALLFNHPSGFFARAEGNWYFQQNLGGTNISTGMTEHELPDESYPQVNLFLGYRFPRHRGDITLGVMNLTGEDYRLNPISPYYEMPRERVFYAQLRFRF